MTTAVQPRVASPRSEITVAADTVIALVKAGVIPDRVSSLSRAAEAAGLLTGDLDQARERYRRRGFLAPRWGEGHPPAPKPKPTRTAWNKTPEGKTRTCIRCKTPKPITEFQQRTDNNSRRTVCDDCRKKYQRERYLSVEASATLGALLRFHVEQGDSVVGQYCTRCNQQVSVGDEVEADEVLVVHAVCP